MGLLPLEFSDCLLDSPYYRENLRAHEKQVILTPYWSAGRNTEL